MAAGVEEVCWCVEEIKVTMVVVDLGGDRDKDDGEGGGRQLWRVVVRCLVLVDLWWRRWCGDGGGDIDGGMIVVVAMKGGRSWPKKSRRRLGWCQKSL
nr:hypothetical protein [Tanacetum cinerariifolium]